MQLTSYRSHLNYNVLDYDNCNYGSTLLFQFIILTEYTIVQFKK